MGSIYSAVNTRRVPVSSGGRGATPSGGGICLPVLDRGRIDVKDISISETRLNNTVVSPGSFVLTDSISLIASWAAGTFIIDYSMSASRSMHEFSSNKPRRGGTPASFCDECVNLLASTVEIERDARFCTNIRVKQSMHT